MEPGSRPLPVTQCRQVERKICAEENCRVEEGEEECQLEDVENTVMVPEETCTLDPETGKSLNHCVTKSLSNCVT